MTFCESLLLDNGILFNRNEKVHFDFAENNVKSATRRAATFVQYRYPCSHNFAQSEYFSSKLDIKTT